MSDETAAKVSDSAAEPQIDLDRQRLAKQYARQKRSLLVADAVLGVSTLIAWQIGLVAGRLHIGGAASILLLFLAILVSYEAIAMPMSWVSYQLARGYGLSTQGPKGWFVDKLKTLGLSAVLGGALVELAYLFIRIQPAWWWAIMAGILLVFTVLLANLAPVLIAPIFFRFTPLTDAALRARLLALAERTRTSVRGVYTMHLSEKTTAANAALMGWGNTRRIVVGDTLTERFTIDETEAVLAHEIGHHVHHDVGKAIVVETAAALAGLWLTALVMNVVLQNAGLLSPLADAQTMPALALIFAFWTLVFTPLTNWSSRVAERRADEYALRTASRPRAFVGSMVRLANQNLAEIDPPRWVEILMYDHPAIQRRIALFDRLNRPT